MRDLGFYLLAALPACSIDNPAFAVTEPTGSTAAATSTTAETTRDPTTTSTPATSTGEPDPTTSTASTASTTAVDPTSTTIDPATGTTQSVDTTDVSSSGTTDNPTCEPPPKNDALDVEVRKNGLLFGPCVDDGTQFKGLLVMDGDTLKLKTTEACKVDVADDQIVLGTGFGVEAYDAGNPCVKANVAWDPNSANCKLGLLDIRLSSDPGTIIYVGAFTIAPPESFPLHTTSQNLTLCGCMNDIPGCCRNPDAGALALIPEGGDAIPQSGKGPAESDGDSFIFYNLQSWMGPECEGGGGRHIDWLARGVN